MDKMSIIIIFIVAVVAGILATIFDARANAVMSADKAKRLTDKILYDMISGNLRKGVRI